MAQSVTDLRENYSTGALDENDADPNPFVMVQQWLDKALAENLPEANAMTLATAALDAKPSARMVLLRGVDEQGFVFFTNYTSRKGNELKANPYAALVFFWQPLHRSIRVEGRVERVLAQESDDYFATRPHGSQLARQRRHKVRSFPIENFWTSAYSLGGAFSRTVLRPAQWGGYRVVPEIIEFWQGRENRLHDRLRYTRAKDHSWKIERLAP